MDDYRVYQDLEYYFRFARHSGVCGGRFPVMYIGCILRERNFFSSNGASQTWLPKNTSTLM
jgi:hypothetical protein